MCSAEDHWKFEASSSQNIARCKWIQEISKFERLNISGNETKLGHSRFQNNTEKYGINLKAQGEWCSFYECRDTSGLEVKSILKLN